MRNEEVVDVRVITDDQPCFLSDAVLPPSMGAPRQSRLLEEEGMGCRSAFLLVWGVGPRMRESNLSSVSVTVFDIH